MTEKVCIFTASYKIHFYRNKVCKLCSTIIYFLKTKPIISLMEDIARQKKRAKKCKEILFTSQTLQLNFEWLSNKLCLAFTSKNLGQPNPLFRQNVTLVRHHYYNTDLSSCSSPYICQYGRKKMLKSRGPKFSSLNSRQGSMMA